MALPPHDSTQSPPKPNNNVIETPRTSNLKFLRSKRLNYFCGKSSQNSLSKTEETQNVGLRKPIRSATPRRCHSAPTSKHVPADSDVAQKNNSRAITLKRETSLQATEEAKPPVSASPQEVKANPEKEDITDISAHDIQHLPTTEMKMKEQTKYRNLQKVAETSCGPDKSIINSLQPKISNPPVPSIHHNLQPVTKENSKDLHIQHSPQAVLRKSGGNVLFTVPVLQSSHEEAAIKRSLTYHDPLSTPKQVKNKEYVPLTLKEPESHEVDVLSTHRSLLRSSFVTDLDQDLLENLSVPETEKLHHVMTWAKKFLDKCNGGEIISAKGEMSSDTMDQDTTFESVKSSRATDEYLKLNSVEFDKYPGDDPKEYAPGQSRLLASAHSMYKPKSKSESKPMSDFLQEQEDHLSEPSCSVYPQLMNSDGKDIFNIKGYADSGEQFFDYTNQGCIESDDLFANRPEPKQQHYNTHILIDTNLDMALEDTSINRNDSSSPESCLDTERLNFLLEDLKLIGLEKKGENDGARTDRTFLVKKSLKKSDDISASEKIPDRLQPALYKVDSNRSLSKGYTRKIYPMCPACSFPNTMSSNWCAECGSALDCAKGQSIKNNNHFELPDPHILSENVSDDFFSFSNRTKSFDNNPMSKQNTKELERTVCWEDNSDVASDSEGSVLEKYFFYVKQLDILRSQEKGKQTKHFQDEHTSEASSDEESSDDYSMPHVGCGPAKPWGETKTLGPETYHFGDRAMKKKNLKGSSEHISVTEGSNLKGLLDRKLQKSPNISSKVTGPKRYWEKSSIAWSSYTHGELKSRSQHSIQRPTSADSKKNKHQQQEDKVTGAVSEHLCKDKWERSTQNHQWMSEGENASLWLLLPDELWIYIFSLLSHGDLSKVAQVCRRFRYIANDDSLWKVITIINYHSIKDSCLVSIGLHHPESISLYRCHDNTQSITDVGFRQLFQHCKDSLKELNITNCSGEIFKGDTVLFYVSHYLTRLISVNISWTGATDRGIISLVQASACLQSLSMNGCNITDNAITALLEKHRKSLIKLEIFGCHSLTAKCLISVATECVHLENLNIGRIPKATDVCLTKIASNLHKITTLNLTGLNAVRDRAVHHIVKQCSNLKNLSLSSCLQVTDVSLVEISTYRTTIKYLDLSGCKKVSDIGIQALARSCQQLQYLDLSSTGTGKRGVCLLASYCYATLECLKLSFCKEVTADAIEKLCKNCTRLKVLHLYGCHVSPDIGYIKKFSKSFQILHDLSIPTANILGE
ncbi:uncharacterized protein LOC142652779 isoform X2 [Rhinoderma darwinii]